MDVIPLPNVDITSTLHKEFSVAHVLWFGKFVPVTSLTVDCCRHISIIATEFLSSMHDKIWWYEYDVNYTYSHKSQIAIDSILSRHQYNGKNGIRLKYNSIYV